MLVLVLVSASVYVYVCCTADKHFCLLNGFWWCGKNGCCQAFSQTITKINYCYACLLHFRYYSNDFIANLLASITFMWTYSIKLLNNGREKITSNKLSIRKWTIRAIISFNGTFHICCKINSSNKANALSETCW